MFTRFSFFPCSEKHVYRLNFVSAPRSCVGTRSAAVRQDGCTSRVLSGFKISKSCFFLYRMGAPEPPPPYIYSQIRGGGQNRRPHAHGGSGEVARPPPRRQSKTVADSTHPPVSEGEVKDLIPTQVGGAGGLVTQTPQAATWLKTAGQFTAARQQNQIPFSW